MLTVLRPLEPVAFDAIWRRWTFGSDLLCAGGGWVEVGDALAAGVGTGIRTREELMLGVGYTKKQVSTLNDNNTSGGFTPEA